MNWEEHGRNQRLYSLHAASGTWRNGGKKEVDNIFGTPIEILNLASLQHNSEAVPSDPV